MKSFFLIFLSLLFSSIAAANSVGSAEEGDVLKLNSGLWEGISETAGDKYYLLQINENGEHQLFDTLLSSAFKKYRTHPFTNDNIACDYIQCTLSITNTYDKTANFRLIVTPHLSDSLNVLEINVDKNNKPILTQSYQLDKKKGKSKVREFVAKYRERIDSLDDSQSDNLLGLWIGISDFRDKRQLAVLDVKEDGKSEYVLMLNGSSSTNAAHFQYEDILVEQNVTTISAMGGLFPKQISLHYQTPNTIVGNTYSYHNEHLIEHSSFRLVRIKKPKN